MPDYKQMRLDKEAELSGTESVCEKCSQPGTIGGNLHVALNVTFGFGVDSSHRFYALCEDLVACKSRSDL